MIEPAQRAVADGRQPRPRRARADRRSCRSTVDRARPARADSSRPYSVDTKFSSEYEVSMPSTRPHSSVNDWSCPSSEADTSVSASASSCRWRSRSGTSAWNAWASRSVAPRFGDDRSGDELRDRRVGHPIGHRADDVDRCRPSLRAGRAARAASSMLSAEKPAGRLPHLLEQRPSSCSGLVRATYSARPRSRLRKAAVLTSTPPARGRALELRHQLVELRRDRRRCRRARASPSRRAAAAARRARRRGSDRSWPPSPCFSRSTSA